MTANEKRKAFKAKIWPLMSQPSPCSNTCSCAHLFSCLWLLLFLPGLTISSLGVPVQAADKIRIGYPSSAGHFITMSLAHKKSFLRDEGLDVDMLRIRPQAAVPALANGEIDYYAGVGPVVVATVQGVPVRLVGIFVPTFPIMLIARPQFKSVSELKGSTIGIGVLGSSPHIVTRLILKHFGLDPDKDVKSVPGGSADSRVAALQQGLISAAVVPPPFDFHARKLGFITLARAQDILTYPEGGLSTTSRKIKERPDEVKRVIKAGIRANRYIRSEREGTNEEPRRKQRGIRIA